MILLMRSGLGQSENPIITQIPADRRHWWVFREYSYFPEIPLARLANSVIIYSTKSWM